MSSNQLPLPLLDLTKPATAEPARNTKLAQRLRDLGDGLQRQIEDKRRPMTQNPTPRRNKMYQSRLHDAANLERVQKALYALANAHESGIIPACLSSVKTKKAIGPLVRTQWASTNYYEGHDSREYGDASEAGRALQAMIAGNPKEEAEAAQLQELQVLEARVSLMVGQIPGFFPTPRAVAERMVRLADIQAGMSVLEPSAGSGAIADVIRELCPAAKIAVIELNHTLRELLRIKGYYLCKEYDFFRHRVTNNGVDGWHRIVMNPPFQNRQDCAHVRHAYDCLQAGGRLVAIMSTGTFFAQGNAKRFRDWLEDKDWCKLDLPPDSFKKSGTGVNVCMVVIDK